MDGKERDERSWKEGRGTRDHGRKGGGREIMGGGRSRMNRRGTRDRGWKGEGREILDGREGGERSWIEGWSRQIMDGKERERHTVNQTNRKTKINNDHNLKLDMWLPENAIAELHYI